MGNDQTNLLDHFARELEVVYRGDVYRVRDNGAVYRKSRVGKQKRPRDDLWTFGRPDDATGYMCIGSQVVHRIITTAFHGNQPSDQHIVDHIDTNRRNNRAENLRWITRLDNVLMNPVTRRRIELAYGSIEAFFENPSSPVNPKSFKNIDWMRAVSKEEAQESRKRLEAWAASGKSPSGGSLGEWVYGKKYPAEPQLDPEPDVQSLSPSVMQRKWKTPTRFAMCPVECTPEALSEYVERLKFGTVFGCNSYGESRTVVAELGDNFISIICNLPDNPVKEWALTKISIEDGRFVHESIGGYFSLQGALKAHCSLMNVPFGDSIDDCL